MRVVVQRVARAAVHQLDVEPVDVRRIERGLVLLCGFQAVDDPATLRWMAEKCLGLRIFADDAGAMNRDVGECGGALLVVPNFTLYGDARKGRRPSFTRAAPPEIAARLFEAFVEMLRAGPVRVEAGWFQAHMSVEIANDGPVTLILEQEPRPAT